jgi:ubiquinone/menaquinone biosynthesis C-methylase UbiE
VIETLGRFGLLPLGDRRILEVGCGEGLILQELTRLGAKSSLLSGIDLIPERIEAAQARLPTVDVRVADAQTLPYKSGEFDLVVVFTVFSSILSKEIACGVAAEIRRVLKPGTGALLWYDLQYNNPWNGNVRGMKRPEVEALFPGLDGHWRSLTVFPPLARKLSVFTAFLYPAFAAIPMARTHLMGMMLKRA